MLIDNIPHTRVGPSRIHGRGLFSEIAFRKGQILGTLDLRDFLDRKYSVKIATREDTQVTVWVTILSPFVVLILIVWLLVTFFRRHR